MAFYWRERQPVGLQERMGTFLLHVRRDIPLALLDLLLVTPSYLGPLVLRFDGSVPSAYWKGFWSLLPTMMLVHLISNYLFGLYGQIWRYASVQEARRVILAGSIAGAVLASLMLLEGSRRPLPMSVILPGSVLALMAFGAVRFQSRLFAFRRRMESHEAKRTLIVGAGDAGALVVKDLLEHPSIGLAIVGIVDDDLRKVGREVHGIPILGTRAALPSLVSRLGVEQVLLAVSSATSDLVKDVAAQCEVADVTLRVLPSVREIVGGKVTARDIRDLRIEDLLGRRQVDTDMDAIGSIINGQRVLVTGAGGSIGSEIARQVAALHPAMLILLDHDETHLHDVQMSLDGDEAVVPVLADIRDRERMLATFALYRPQLVFHAAAHKHVPLLEFHPAEAVLTNVIGTANITDAAAAAGVQRLVLISTDKAVRPVNVMGATKWFAEQIVRSIPESDCVCCAVRFGNVLGSRGSVIPTFLRQIRGGGPVTVTDPSMTRYFMSIAESVELVLQAAALSRDREVLTLDMGEPVSILDLARKLVRLSGRVPDRDVRIAIVGRRPGEKLSEDLIDPDEELLPSGHPGITISRPPVPDRPALRRALRELEALVEDGNSDLLAARVKELALQALRSVATGSAP